MKNYDVSLDVQSDALTLSELSSRLGHPPGPGSHSRGDSRSANLGVFAASTWSLYSKAPTAAPLEEHFSSIKSQLSPERLHALHGAPGIKSIFIDVAIFLRMTLLRPKSSFRERFFG